MKKHIYACKKTLAFALAFAMIVGFWSVMKLDARAEDQEIEKVEIKVKDPVPGQSFPGVNDVSVITPEGEIEVTDIEWWKNGTQVTQGSVEYNTKYMVAVWLKAKGNYKFSYDPEKKINDSSENISWNKFEDYKVIRVTHDFPATAPDPAKTIDSVNIKIDPPVSGKTFATTCEVSVPGVIADCITWYYKDTNKGQTYKPAEYNTVYWVKVRLSPKTMEGYKFASEVKVTVNEQNITNLMMGDRYEIYVKYEFPATGPEPSGWDYVIIEGDGNNYVPGSDEPLSFRGNGEFNDFLRVEVDDNIVEEQYYTKKEGSTIITFTPEYLATLSEGSHTVKMFWDASGQVKSAEASFYIGEKGGEVVPGNADTTQPENNPAKENSNVSSESTTSMTVNNVARHTCNFEWVITVDPTTGGDGLEEYRCTGCGAVSQSHPIAASVAVIKDFYGKVKEAPENGNITYDSGKLYTISDYLLKKMAERNDVSVTVKFEYKNRKYQLTFPAGLDYSTVLTDEETMYGYFGAAAKLGLKVTEQ